MINQCSCQISSHCLKYFVKCDIDSLENGTGIEQIDKGTVTRTPEKSFHVFVQS